MMTRQTYRRLRCAVYASAIVGIPLAVIGALVVAELLN
jgi:hypothetical protein